MLQKALQFLQENKPFYIATVEDGKPRVRPFGLAFEHGGKLWFGTANTKPIYRQLQANSNVEISTTSPTAAWVRLSGKAVFESNFDAKRKAFELMPTLSDIYKSGPEDPTFEVFYLADAEVVFQSMSTYGQESEVYRL